MGKSHKLQQNIEQELTPWYTGAHNTYISQAE